MFENILKKINKVIDATEQVDDRFYAEVMDEISRGFKDQALVGKAIAQADKIDKNYDSIYVKLRASLLQDKYIKEKKANQQQQQIKHKKQKKLNYSIQIRFNDGYFSTMFSKEIESKGYITSIFSGVNDFKKLRKKYHGEIDYKTMCYVIVSEQGEIMETFKFEPT